MVGAVVASLNLRDMDEGSNSTERLMIINEMTVYLRFGN